MFQKSMWYKEKGVTPNREPPPELVVVWSREMATKQNEERQQVTADAELIIDGYYLRNVILRDVQIAYNGGPLILENVYFVNCNFKIVPNLAGQQFSASVLASAATTFKAS